MSGERSGLVVVGAGPAGLSAARGYREAGGAGGVVLVGDEHELPYHRPPLSKELLRGEGDERKLPIESAAWLREHRIALAMTRALSLDTGQRTVELADGRTLAYDLCVLAPGAEPARLPVPGADDPRVRVLRTIHTLHRLLDQLTPGEPVAVIGSGFIGCEAAASLRRRGHPVTLVSDEAAPQARRLGDEVAQRLLGWLHDEGVETVTNTAVDAIEHGASRSAVRAGNATVGAGTVLMAAGARPRVELAHAAGVPLAEGAIAADSHLRTLVPGVLAAGDACRAAHPLAGRPLRVEHWGDALAQGEAAGRTAAGEQAEWDTVPGFWSTIGARTLKYAAWGDGFADVRVVDHADGAFTAWYADEDGRAVGVLAHEADGDYDRGRELIAAGEPAP